MDEVNVARPRAQRGDTARARNAEETRRALILAARSLFAARGYHAVGVRDVAASAGVTRGAINHHFPGKEALFLAVFDQIENELVAEGVQRRLSQASTADPWTTFREGIQAYLDHAVRPDVQRITLIDAPAVLGWMRWRELEARYGLGAIVGSLNAAMDSGQMTRRPVEPLAHLILGSAMEAAMLIANSDQPQARRRDVGEALDDLLRALETGRS